MAAGERASSAYASKTGLRELLLEAVRTGAYPQYGYGLVQATGLAARLGIAALSALELGVAGGNGLVALEELCRRHSGPSGVDLRAVGFDLGEGLPAPLDHRDARTSGRAASTGWTRRSCALASTGRSSSSAR